ncbi:sensor histidine kinase KdpD [Marinobacter sp. SS5-14b]|uniref:sensor histidine kinase n=1 Tax=Marinobacter sp. SS5-14b TaxID=3050456 RepID=UPI0026DFB7FE|nr:HAMP domain-containing sensor histidine kinase [Marinobacter sp. SS5-14b]
MNAEQIRRQQTDGFLTLRFEPTLETRYRQARSALIRQRARVVSIAGLLLFLVYALMDVMTLPRELAQVTAFIRLAFICPIIALVLWLSHCTTLADEIFEKVYTLAYLAGGMSVIAIIVAARMQAYPLPYEGMILMLMFGYFAMGLPFIAASVTSFILVCVYLLAELWAGSSIPDTLINVFFLMTANVIGMVGAWMTEHRHRAHFLDRQLLDLMHRAAQDESRRKTELITAASHDLRQPLNVIDITLENLRPAGQGDQHNNMVRQLKDMVSQLRRLLGTVFDSARLNEGMIRPELEPVQVSDAFRSVQALTEDTFHDRGLRLFLEPSTVPASIQADPALLQRVLQNLIINAADHSGGDTVRLGWEKRSGTVRMMVSDNGRGLPEGLEGRLFQPYVRGSGQNDYPGLGLGLTIVQEFTHLMRGRCGANSTPQGSVFWIELPLSVTANPAPAPC